MTKELMPWAQAEADDFYSEYGDGNCSCHLSAPCGSCCHPGNPLNLENDPFAWGEVHEVMALEAVDTLRQFIDKLVKRHIVEMAHQEYSA